MLRGLAHTGDWGVDTPMVISVSPIKPGPGLYQSIDFTRLTFRHERATRNGSRRPEARRE